MDTLRCIASRVGRAVPGVCAVLLAAGAGAAFGSSYDGLQGPFSLAGQAGSGLYGVSVSVPGTSARLPALLALVLLFAATIAGGGSGKGRRGR